MQADPHAHDLELQDRQPSHTSNSSTHSKSYVGVGIESTASSPTRSLGDRPGSCSGKFADEDEKEIDDEESDVVRWDGPDDPENPRNWPAKKKSMVTMESCLISFTVCMSVSLMSPAVPDIAVEFGVGQVMTTLGYSLYVGALDGLLAFEEFTERLTNEKFSIVSLSDGH